MNGRGLLCVTFSRSKEMESKGEMRLGEDLARLLNQQNFALNTSSISIRSPKQDPVNQPMNDSAREFSSIKAIFDG
jgi:hypothetical protein